MQDPYDLPSSHRFWPIALGIAATLAIGLISLSFFFPMFGQKAEIQQGHECNDNLERIFEAKQALARTLNLAPGQPYPNVVQQLTVEDIAPFLRQDKIDLSCPSGGNYQIRPLVDANGEVIPPICDKGDADPDGNGVKYSEEGLHAHYRSHLQNSDTGLFYRDPGLTFPGDKDSAATQ